MTVGQRLRASLDTLTSLAIVLVAGVIAFRLLVPATAGGAAAARLSMPFTDNVDVGSAPSAGTGQIVLVEFSDFECPYCRTFHETVLPRIRTDYIDSGRVRYVAMSFPLPRHPRAVAAAVAASCADQQGQYWGMRNRLFTAGDLLDDVHLKQYATELGLDVAAFGRCQEGPMRSVVEAEKAEGNRLGVSGTPTFFLGTQGSDDKIITLHRRIDGALPFAAFEREIIEFEATGP